MTTIDDTNTEDELGARPAAYFFALADVPQPGPWIRGAACRTAPPGLFFVTRGETVAPAQAICRNCGVRDACLEYALDAGHELKGVWAGTSERERRRLITDRNKAAFEPAPPVDELAERRARKPPSEPGRMYATLEALAAHPHRWARIASYPSHNSGGALASLLRNGQKPSPPGQWTFEGRVNDTGGSDLYARYDGPDTSTDADAKAR